MKAKLTIMGCGNSTGVPSIGNFWGACDPDEPKNTRTRSSILVQTDETNIVVDSGPDFKHQLNRTNVGVDELNAVLYSHAHSDHISGIDDLRIISYKSAQQIPIYGNKETLQELEERFNYLFEGENHELYPPIVKPVEIKYGQKHKIGDIEFTPFEQDHGTCSSVGYRFGDTAYCVDLVNLDQAAIDILKGIKILIIDAAGYKMPNNKVHANLDKIYSLNEQIGAAQTYLTSLTLAMDYQILLEELPDGYLPAYDGLSLDISW